VSYFGITNCALRDTFGLLEGLIYLNMSHNQIQGSVPVALWGHYNIHTFDLSYNRFSGALPPVQSNTKNFTWLDLSHNQFTGSLSPFGSLPSFWTQYSMLEHMYDYGP
jgi:Leucine-rich repeat (LRR) protein